MTPPPSLDGLPSQPPFSPQSGREVVRVKALLLEVVILGGVIVSRLSVNSWTYPPPLLHTELC